MTESDRELQLREACTRFVHWHGVRSPAAPLAELPEEIRADKYGDGGAYHRHASAIARALRRLPDVEVVPDPPDTPRMHVSLRTTDDAFGAAALVAPPAGDLRDHA